MSIIEREVQSVPEVLTEREQRARILEAAALEIEVRGWAHCDYDPSTGGVCANGAIGMALGLEPEFVRRNKPGFIAALQRSGWGGHHPYSAIAHWNDMPGRTAAEATFLLRWRAEEIRDGR